jgi:hypothetical protein
VNNYKLLCVLKNTQNSRKASKEWQFSKAGRVVRRLHARWIESAVAIASPLLLRFPLPAGRLRLFFERGLIALSHTHTRLIPCSSNELFDVCVFMQWLVRAVPSVIKVGRRWILISERTRRRGDFLSRTHAGALSRPAAHVNTRRAGGRRLQFANGGSWS